MPAERAIPGLSESLSASTNLNFNTEQVGFMGAYLIDRKFKATLRSSTFNQTVTTTVPADAYNIDSATGNNLIKQGHIFYSYNEGSSIPNLIGVQFTIDSLRILKQMATGRSYVVLSDPPLVDAIHGVYEQLNIEIPSVNTQINATYDFLANQQPALQENTTDSVVGANRKYTSVNPARIEIPDVPLVEDNKIVDSYDKNNDYLAVASIYTTPDTLQNFTTFFNLPQSFVSPLDKTADVVTYTPGGTSWYLTQGTATSLTVNTGTVTKNIYIDNAGNIWGSASTATSSQSNNYDNTNVNQYGYSNPETYGPFGVERNDFLQNQTTSYDIFADGAINETKSGSITVTAPCRGLFRLQGTMTTNNGTASLGAPVNWTTTSTATSNFDIFIVGSSISIPYNVSATGAGNYGQLSLTVSFYL